MKRPLISRRNFTDDAPDRDPVDRLITAIIVQAVMDATQMGADDEFARWFLYDWAEIVPEYLARHFPVYEAKWYAFLADVGHSQLTIPMELNFGPTPAARLPKTDYRGYNAI